MILRVAKIREEAKLPVRAYPTDAGMDLFFCPDEEMKEKIISREGFAIEVRDSVVLPTGLKIEVPANHMLEIKNKSGIASKRQLLVGACVVDCGYTGEIFVNLHNISLKTQYIKPGDKLAQAVLVPISCCEVSEIKHEDFIDKTARGDGGFGSTGDK
jgi:dUTP pyrophosphatase